MARHWRETMIAPILILLLVASSQNSTPIFIKGFTLSPSKSLAAHPSKTRGEITLSPKQPKSSCTNVASVGLYAHNNNGEEDYGTSARRTFLSSIAAFMVTATLPIGAGAEEATTAAPPSPVQVIVSGDAKKLFNEGRALEMQGNMYAAQRIYSKVTKIVPRFIYGWSNLGNTQVVLNDLPAAEESYTTAINLCNENIKEAEATFGVRRCDDLYVLLLNRGSLRMNNGMAKEALRDLEQADALRGRPDAIVLQNRARARELNGLFSGADRDYTVAISMTSNEVSPFWLRSSLIKYQLGDKQGAFDIMRRVENKFPEAPEVRAAYATMLVGCKNDLEAAQKKFLEIPDRQRLNYSDQKYLRETISWPPAAIETLGMVTKAVGGGA